MLTINQEQPKQAVNLSRSAGRHRDVQVNFEHSSLEKTDMFTGGTSNDIIYVLHLCSISKISESRSFHMEICEDISLQLTWVS